VDYVTKPLQYEEVLARVTTHLRIRELQQRLETQNTLLQEKNVQLQTEVTERKRIAKRLKKVNQQLKESNASKDTLFSIIAHDLRAPFSALISLSETVIHYIDDYSREDIRDNMLRIRASSEAVYSLLENLLAWSRLQRGLLQYRPSLISLHAIAEENVALFKPQAEQKRLNLYNLIAEDMMVYADKSMLDTIMRNLLSNALKFTAQEGTIKVFATPTDEFIEIAVSDTGIGMAKKTIPKLFHIGTHYTRGGTEGESGTGLGLSLCKELVEEHHGTIWVESEEGCGSTFRFTLPCCREQSV
jgi:signal transduction histidine kinase